MKRGATVLEQWTTKEKLCLSSAVLRSGEQNWMTVSRFLRVFGEQGRPSEWYSQKQCALQYESLLNTLGTSKRKKRNEKGVETMETPSESIVRKLLQERLEEVHQIIEENRRDYRRVKQEKEDIESGRADDRLDEFERELEEEKEREATGGSILRQHEERSRLESGRLTPHLEPLISTENSHEQPESRVPTSPLLTSLLQSPSHYRGAALHNLLNPPPLVSRINDSPTLSRLLESPSKQLEPTVLFQIPVKKEPVEEGTRQPGQLAGKPTVFVQGHSKAVQQLKQFEIKTETPEDKELNSTEEDEKLEENDEEDTGTQELEVEISVVDMDKTPPVANTKLEPEEPDTEKEEQENSSLNTLQDSDIMDEHQSLTELDRQTVNMIVAGGGVISVSHDTSSEHLELTSSDIQHKDDSETAESLKEDSLDDVSDEINENMKEVDSAISVNIASTSCQAVEVEALNNFIIGTETPKDNYVVQLLCATPENILEEEAKTPEIKESQKTEKSQQDLKTTAVVEIDEEINMEGAVLEVGGGMLNLGGAVVVEEEMDPTVHEVEVLVSELNTTSVRGKCLEEEDSTQDGEIKEVVRTPETEPLEESQEEDEAVTPKASSNEENEREDKDDDDKPLKESLALTLTPKIIEAKADSPRTIEGDNEVGPRRLTKRRRLVSGSVCSDSKPSSPACHTEDTKEYRAWKKSIMLVYNRMATHKYASIFLRPITNEQAPAYDTVIHRPVDLSTIKKRIETGELRSTEEFQKDLLLMFQNAIMYNNRHTHVYEMATTMQQECMPHIELMVEAMGEGVRWCKDSHTVDRIPTRGRGEGLKRKRTTTDNGKSAVTPKRRKETST